MGVGSWPAHYITGCPPSSATAPDGRTEGYRFVHQDPPLESDFRSCYDEDPTLYASDCRARAFSLFNTKAAALRAQGRVPGLRKFPHVARGIPPVDSGMWSAPSSGGHISWWVYDGYQVHTLFHVVFV